MVVLVADGVVLRTLATRGRKREGPTSAAQWEGWSGAEGPKENTVCDLAHILSIPHAWSPSHPRQACMQNRGPAGLRLPWDTQACWRGNLTVKQAPFNEKDLL